MNRREIEHTCRFISQAFNLYNDPYIGNVAHEIAHALLLYGRVFVDMDQTISNRINPMSPSRANVHEVRACALEIAGLRQLGYRASFRKTAERSWPGLENQENSRKFRTQADLARAIKAETPSPMLVERFVRVYRDFARYA